MKCNQRILGGRILSILFAIFLIPAILLIISAITMRKYNLDGPEWEKKKRSDKLKGRPKSEEWKKKASEAAKRRWQRERKKKQQENNNEIQPTLQQETNTTN